MNRDGHDNVKFFIGPEVEMTPAHGKKTLFVVGEQPATEIEKHAKEQGASHVFLGANHSFDDTAVIESWVTMITELLAKGFTVTLDYSVEFHGFLLDHLPCAVWKSRNFIPLVSVRIRNIENSGPNLTIKIDDVDFAATNPGVWCMHYSELIDSNRFTGWTDYGTDFIIGKDALPASVVESPDTVSDANTLVVTETVAVNLAEVGLDATGITAMEQKGELETAGDTTTVSLEDMVSNAKVEEPAAEVTTPDTTPEVEVKEKKKTGKKND